MYGYSNPWGIAPMSSGGLMAPVQQMAVPEMSTGDVTGYGVPGGTIGNRGPTTPDDLASKQGIASALGGYGLSAAKNTALDAMSAYGMGFSPSVGQIAGRAVSNLAAPSAITGFVGDVIGKQMGMTAPTGVFGKVARNVISPAITGLLGMVNPALGLTYGLMGPMAMDAVGDVTNTRKDENFKDELEAKGGYFGGRVDASKIGGMIDRAGFESIAHAMANQGIGPTDLARGLSNKDASSVARGGNPMGNTYGSNRGIGFSNAVGGPIGGARAVDAAYGRSMGGFAGLGIGNPSSYGGGDRDSDRGGFGANDGNSDTAGNGGYGR